MKFRECSFPFRVGINGDIASCNTLEECINNEIKFLFYTEKKSISAFPEVGASPNVFGLVNDQYFGLKNAVFQSEIERAIKENIQPIKDVVATISWLEAGILRIDFYYTLISGEKYQYSLNYYTTREQ